MGEYGCRLEERGRPVIVTGPGVVEWVAKRTNEYGNFGCAQGIGWAENGDLIAGVAYNEYNGVNCCMHVAAIGKRWLKRQYLWACFDYPFNQLKVKRVTGLVGEGNLQARKFDEHLGFDLEATFKGAHPTGDLLVYVLWKDKCRWIRPEFAQQYALAA